MIHRTQNPYHERIHGWRTAKEAWNEGYEAAERDLVNQFAQERGDDSRLVADLSEALDNIEDGADLWIVKDHLTPEENGWNSALRAIGEIAGIALTLGRRDPE